MKNIAVLGSTGSIGVQTLDVIEHSKNMRVTALTANKNTAKLEDQIRRFSPDIAVLYDSEAARDLKTRVADTKTRVLSGEEGLCDAAAYEKNDTVVEAVSGSVGIKPAIAAIRKNVRLALANKEAMVCAGDIINEKVQKEGAEIVPIDSEHSAVFQCLQNNRDRLKKIILTASGGPFFGKTKAELSAITPAEALRHPNWDMGAKITIDCATLVNKGLELIEAIRLFGVSANQIEVLVHRQSIIHSMVEFVDNSVIAQIGMPDMRIPISYALTYPDRTENPSSSIDFTKLAPLTFEKPDMKTFYGLQLAFDAINAGGTMPTAYNGANEAAVDLFLKEKITFLQIPELIEYAMHKHKVVLNPDLESIINTDTEARQSVYERI
ncbi:MAG: 1-deoxy-D-xylulose-5-phosphate reductoisomerase [Clostridia bacterium]|nr:1-deoxy-D-xylulose-5-phosphate reductoisomerase [Clostridia bacterium]